MSAGVLRWTGYGVGGALIAAGLTGLLLDGHTTRPIGWALWFGGGIAAHDGLIVPMVLLVGAVAASQRGPFRGPTRVDLRLGTPELALAHPTWSMGRKITIDSATLMNKALEVIEAHWLFGTPYDRIHVVVHPQSIVHALVSLHDGSTLAHLGLPDMRVPIAYALHHPERVEVPVPTLDLAAVGRPPFEPPDEEALPCLRLAREAAAAGGTATCVLNAANEVAVHAFLRGQLGFMGIPAVIDRTLEALPPTRVHSFETLYAADAEGRRLAAEAIGAGTR